MKDHQEAFKKFSKKKWIEHISSSLRKGRIDDFKWELDNGISGPVFAHQDDLKRIVSPLNSEKSNNDWLIGLHLQKNSLIEKSLPEGIQSILLDINIEEDFILKSIPDRLDHLYINLHGKETISALTKKMADSKWSIRTDHLFEMDPVQVHREIRKAKGFYSLVIPLNSVDESKFPVKQLSAVFKALATWFKRIEDKTVIFDLMNCLSFEIEISSDILFEISRLRALKLLWYNFQQVYDRKPIIDTKLLARINLKKLTGDENQQLILATTAAAAAILGGMETLVFDPGEANENLERAWRLTRNIQLILKEESGLDLVKDPLAGSYAIENLTEKIAIAAWEGFVSA